MTRNALLLMASVFLMGKTVLGEPPVRHRLRAGFGMVLDPRMRLTPQEKEIRDLVNRERAAAGLSALVLRAELRYAALAHAYTMAQRNLGEHVIDGENGEVRIRRQGYEFTSWGENIGWGFGGAAAPMVQWWMNSQAHRDNMLNPAFEHLGIAIAVAANGTPYYCLVLGSLH